MIWDVERFEWNDLEAMGTAGGVPSALRALISAATEEEALRAYWQIDNVVVVQGALFEAALPTAVCAVSSLPACSVPARPYLLELLAQLAGNPDDEGVSSERAGLRERCAAEVSRGFVYYISFLEHGTAAERMWCVDLLGLCALRDGALTERVVWHLNRLRQEVLGADLATQIDNWRRRLSASGPPPSR